MALIQAKCKNCGANLMVHDNGEVATCPFCNAVFLIRDAINNYYYSNNISAENLTIEDTTVENKIRSGEAFLKMGRFQEALSLFTEISLCAPYDYRGWLGIIRSITEDFAVASCSRSSLVKLQDAFTNLKLFMPKELEESYSRYFSYYENLRKKTVEEEAERMTRLHEINEEKKQIENRIRECDNRIKLLEEKTFSYHTIASGKPSHIILLVAFVLGLILLVSGNNISLSLAFLLIPALIVLFVAVSNASTKKKMQERNQEITASTDEKIKLQKRYHELEQEAQDAYTVSSYID